MTANAASKKTNSVKSAKRAFFVALFDLSWRLLIAMLVPIFIGLLIDSKNGGGRGFAFAGFGVGIICGFFVMRSIVSKLAKQGDNK